MANSITPLYNGIIGSKENQDLFRILGNFCLTNADNPFVYDYVGTTFRIMSGTFVWNGILYKITSPIFNNNITNGYIFLYEYAGQIEIESSVGIENDPNYVYIGRMNNGVFIQSIRDVNHSLENLTLLLNRMTDVESVNTTQNTRLTKLEADTGWIDIPYNTGWSGGTGGQLQYRKIGNQVFLRGGVGQTVIADGEYRQVTTGGLPPTFRPPTEVRFTGMGSSGRSIGWRITVTGNIDVINQASNTNATWASVFCSWLLD